MPTFRKELLIKCTKVIKDSMPSSDYLNYLIDNSFYKNINSWEVIALVFLAFAHKADFVNSYRIKEK